MRYITRPLTDEARARLKNVRREGSPFSGSWKSTLETLDRELWHLGVRTDFVLQIDCQESDLRLDGELRANARPASPAVGISIKSSKGDLLFVCGKFPQWQHNVRAIALGLEALRKVDRYGITQSSEQYRGWQALPPGTPMPAAPMTVDEARAFLGEAAGLDAPASPTNYVAVFREAVRIHHPDNGGDAAMFDKVVKAKEILEAVAA